MLGILEGLLYVQGDMGLTLEQVCDILNISYEDAVMLAVYDKDEGWIIDGYQYWLTAQVTAWQPLPEPWKGEVNE